VLFIERPYLFAIQSFPRSHRFCRSRSALPVRHRRSQNLSMPAEWPDLWPDWRWSRMSQPVEAPLTPLDFARRTRKAALALARMT
jgi:hypothetical protein